MQLVGISNQWPRLLGHLGDCGRIQGADPARVLNRQRAAKLHRARPPFLEGRIVEISVRIRIQDFVAELGRLGRIDSNGSQRPVTHALQDRLQSVQIHRLVQAVGDCFVHQRMVGNANLAHEIFAAGDLVGKHRREQIVGAHPLNRRRHLPASGEARHCQSAGRVPFPARSEHRGIEQRLRQHVLHGWRLEKTEHQLQRKRMLVAQRKEQPVVRRRRLQLEVERTAEPLSQR